MVSPTASTKAKTRVVISSHLSNDSRVVFLDRKHLGDIGKQNKPASAKSDGSDSGGSDSEPGALEREVIFSNMSNDFKMFFLTEAPPDFSSESLEKIYVLRFPQELPLEPKKIPTPFHDPFRNSQNHCIP